MIYNTLSIMSQVEILNTLSNFLLKSVLLILNEIVQKYFFIPNLESLYFFVYGFGSLPAKTGEFSRDSTFPLFLKSQ